jgi:hypothetical protein
VGDRFESGEDRIRSGELLLDTCERQVWMERVVDRPALKHYLLFSRLLDII